MPKERFLVQAVFTRSDGSQALVDLWFSSNLMFPLDVTGTLEITLAERPTPYATWGPPLEGKLS